jgi:hypothetical protein
LDSLAKPSFGDRACTGLARRWQCSTPLERFEERFLLGRPAACPALVTMPVSNLQRQSAHFGVGLTGRSMLTGPV